MNLLLFHRKWKSKCFLFDPFPFAVVFEKQYIIHYGTDSDKNTKKDNTRHAGDDEQCQNSAPLKRFPNKHDYFFGKFEKNLCQNEYDTEGQCNDNKIDNDFHF